MGGRRRGDLATTGWGGVVADGRREEEGGLSYNWVGRGGGRWEEGGLSYIWVGRGGGRWEEGGLTATKDAHGTVHLLKPLALVLTA